MTPVKTEAGAVLNANAKLLSAFLAGSAAWFVWPDGPEWWGFAILSALLGLLAARKFVEAFLAIRKISARNRAITTLTRDTIEPKSSSLVSKDELRKAGMIE